MQLNTVKSANNYYGYLQHSNTSNLQKINFKKNNDETSQMYYITPQQSYKKKLDSNDIAKWLSIGVSAVFLIYFGKILAREYKTDRVKGKLKNENLEKMIPKSNDGLNTEGVKSIGSYLKFEKVVDDPLIANIRTTKTINPDDQEMFINMLEDSKIEEKYIKAAGLEHKPFPNAAILTGPPGCGKTERVRMYAKESKAIFAPIKLTDFSNSYVNGTAGNMSVLFEDIEKLAKQNPNTEFVYLFDEIDGMCRKLENISADKNYLNENRQTFLKGLESILRCKNVKCFGATNAPIKDIDEAVISRFGRTIDIKLPNKVQLKEALKFHLKDTKNINDFLTQKDGDVDKFVDDMTKNKYSFRDLQKVINDAQAQHCRDMNKQKNDSLPFNIEYLKKALKQKGKTSGEIGSHI